MQATVALSGFCAEIPRKRHSPTSRTGISAIHGVLCAHRLPTADGTHYAKPVSSMRVPSNMRKKRISFVATQETNSRVV
jgi:hypothetical protein